MNTLGLQQGAEGVYFKMPVLFEPYKGGSLECKFISGPKQAIFFILMGGGQEVNTTSSFIIGFLHYIWKFSVK